MVATSVFESQRTADPLADWSGLIVKTPGTCSGEPRIAGTRIKVKHIYRWVEEQGMTPAQVVEQYPHLTRSGVHAALAYFWSHEVEIRGAIEEEERFVAKMKAKAAPSPLQAKHPELNAQNDPLSLG